MLLWGGALAGDSCGPWVDLVFRSPEFSGDPAIPSPFADGGKGNGRSPGGAIESLPRGGYRERAPEPVGPLLYDRVARAGRAGG